MNAGELLRWAMDRQMPPELVKRGRNLWLERYRQLLRVYWPKAMGGEREAAEFVRQIGRDVRQMMGLDEPKRHKHSGDADGEPIKFTMNLTKPEE